MQLWVRVLAIGVLFGCCLPAEPGGDLSNQVLDSYLAATRSQQERLNGSTAEISIDADIPQLHKHGRLSALRHISRLGRITYDRLRFEGDSAVKNDVIARYLNTEIQIRESKDQSLSVIPTNYKFAYKGRREFNGRDVHVFELKPRARRKGLFKGTLWIDARTYLPVRESGLFVKNPSVFIKKVQFTRDYQNTHGLAVVARLETTVETRVVGPAHMTVYYADYHFEPSSVEVGLIATDSQ